MQEMGKVVFILFLIILLIRYVIENYLDKRNRDHIREHSEQVPPTFASKISLEDHQKAAQYSLAKIKMKSFFDFFELLILLGWTYAGGLNFLDRFVTSFHLSTLSTGVIVFLLFGFVSFLLGLPQSLYSTFVLEEKFGFNKTTFKTFILDTVKSSALGLLLGVPLLYALLAIMNFLGTYWWFYAWAFLTFVQFLLMWAYPRFLAPIFNKFTPLEDGEVKEKIENLMKRTGFESKGLFVMDASKRSSHGNAYFTGLGKNKRIVFFDNLIKTLTSSEVEAVMAHELGHFKKRHIVKMLVKGVFSSFLGLYILGLLSTWPPFFQGHGVETVSPYMALLLFSLVLGNYTFLLTPLNSWMSRKYEFEADTFAHENSNGENLISALVKMYKDNASTLTPDPIYSAFYHSHPPALIRVEFLKKLMEKNS